MIIMYFISGLLQVALLAFFVAVGMWAYRQWRLPSVPWLLAYVFVVTISPWFLPYLVNHVIDQVFASEQNLISSGMTVGQSLSLISGVEACFTVMGKVLVVWFIVSELAYAYSLSTSTQKLPALATIPRRHSMAVGIGLIICVMARPMIWITLWSTQA